MQQKNTNFSKTFYPKSEPDPSIHAPDSARQNCSPVRKRSEPPIKSYEPKNFKNWQRHQFWDQKLSIWSTKSDSIEKRQQGLLRISSFGGRMQHLR